MTRVAGRILTPRGFVDGELAIGPDGRIASLTGDPVPEARVRDGSRPVVLPGFVDLHVHGGGGHDVMEGGEAAVAIARLHARHGTTSILATTMTAPSADLEAAFAGLAPHVRTRPPRGARIHGVHLEGP